MIGEFEIHTFRPDTVEELAKFLGAEYPEGDISEEKYLSWEYLHNPSGKAIVTTARNSENKIVAQYALLPAAIYADGKIIPATLSLNTLTSKNYRGKGLFTSTADETFAYCKRSDVEFTFGVPNKNSFPGFVNKLEFKHAGDLIFLAKALKPFNVMKQMMNGSDEKKGEAIKINLDWKSLSDNSISELRFPEDELQYSKFLNAFLKQGVTSIHRTSEFIQWRYTVNPSRAYFLLKIVSGGEIKAMVVIRSMHLYGMRVCVVMDALGIEKKYSEKLIQVISSEARKNYLDLMIAIAAHRKSKQFEQFLKAGFWSVPKFMLPQQLPFIIKIHNDKFDTSGILDLKKWHFSFGDYDVF